MSRELLLARRLFEAAADPDADRQSAEDAAFELAQVFGRTEVPAGRGLPVASFAEMTADDLSPHAWLLLLESRRPGEAGIPNAILDSVFVENADPVIRFRLVSGALRQDGPGKSMDWLIGEGDSPISLKDLPPTWPRDLMIDLANPEDGEGTARAAILAEMALYLLQDGSPSALALAAAAIAPDQSWRAPARATVGSLVRAVDPNFTGIGRYFRNARV